MIWRLRSSHHIKSFKNERLQKHRRHRTKSSCSCMYRSTVLRCLALLLFSSRVQAAIEDEFIEASPELRSQVPARLVFNQDDLARCLADSSAKRCVLRGGPTLSFSHYHPSALTSVAIACPYNNTFAAVVTWGGGLRTQAQFWLLQSEQQTLKWVSKSWDENKARTRHHGSTGCLVREQGIGCCSFHCSISLGTCSLAGV
jgi:hypothetical protein